jgi:LPS export ABC transporter protein LptC
MIHSTNTYNKSVWGSLALLVLICSCESQFKEVQKMGVSVFAPTGEADSINLTYTDSGQVQANLKSLKMKDYGGVTFPFTEFPKGIFLTLFDKKGSKTYVKADYAVSYRVTNLIDLQHNVVIYTDAGQKMTTEQLYYDQKQEWFFTEQVFQFTDPKGNSTGKGIDFSRDFKIVKTHDFSGQVAE